MQPNDEHIKGPWSPEEDAILSKCVEKFGARNWSLIARTIPGRSGKSCRLRWSNQLNLGVNRKGVNRKPFTGSELGEQNKAAVEKERKDILEIQITESDGLLGMRKWLSEYHNKRPGFHVLQQQIDDYITSFEANEEKARQEREAAAAEEGWTVVEHQKGRKKTTDMESGISVGGVSAAAVQRKHKKQMKNSALNFYRFQRREACRNEILELQQRFEEDKKKIATLRAARKFRPY